MMQNETRIQQDVNMYDIPSSKEKAMGTLRMSTYVSSPRVLPGPGHLPARSQMKKPSENPISLSSPSSNSSRPENSSTLASNRPNIEAIEILSRKVSDNGVLQRFQNADTAFMLATGDIFMKSSDVLRSGQSDGNDVSIPARTYSASETPFTGSLIPSSHRNGMTLNGVLQDIAVTNAIPRSKHLITTEISTIESPGEKIPFRQSLPRNYPSQSTRTNPNRPFLSGLEAEHSAKAYFSNQRTATSTKYPLAFKNSSKLSMYPEDNSYRSLKGSIRRPPSRSRQSATVFGKSQSNEHQDKSKMTSESGNKLDLKIALNSSKSTNPKIGSNSMLGVSKAIQQLGLGEKRNGDVDLMGNMKGAEITGISYQNLTGQSIKRDTNENAEIAPCMIARRKKSVDDLTEYYNGSQYSGIDQSTVTTENGQDDESASVITQDTGVYENEEEDIEDGMEGEMHEDMGGSQGDFCPDDNDIDCIDDTAIGSLEDDDNATEGEEISESARTSVIGDSHRDSLDEAANKPSLIKSVFSNCPPVIQFCTKHEKVEPLPAHVRKLLKWKMSPITPIVVRNTVARSGFKPSKKNYDWIGYFGKHMKASGFRSLKEYQKINHFPGSFQLGRKDRLWRNLSRMQAKFGKKEFGFVPQSYILPWDKKLLKAAWEEGSSKHKYIIKPPASARGIGIKLVHKWNQIPTRKPVLVQKYLSKPLLLNGFKFDIRLYVYVSSFDPLRIYLFDDGLVRFATTKYSTSSKHLSNRYMHLTNYSINKHSGVFQQNDDVNVCQGHKWSLKALWRHLQEKGVNTDKIWAQMKDIVIKTLISVEHFTNSLIKANCRRKSCCHELFGFDIMVDDRYQPWILEVNISPSLHSNSPLDVEIKGQMVSDMFNIAGFQLPDKRQIMSFAPSPTSSGTSSVTGSTFSQDKRKESLEITCDTRAKHSYFARHYKQFCESELMTMMLDVLTVNDIQMLVETEDENSRRGHFQRIFPGGEETRKYSNYFEQPRYYNALLHMWELKYANHKQKGVLLLESFCRRGLHLVSSVTSSTRAIPMEHVWTMARQSKIFASPRTDPKYLPIVVKSSASLSALCSSNSAAQVPFPGRISSAGRWETSSTKTLGAVSANDMKINSSRSVK